jgi:hypothetical protein
VWAAFREPGKVSIAIWEGRQKSSGAGTVRTGDAPLSTGTVQTRRLALHLHVALARSGASVADEIVFLPIAPPIRPGAIYSYDIVFKAESGDAPVGLLGMGLLADDPAGAGGRRAIEGVSEHAPRHLALGYEDGFLPSFATSAGLLPDIRIAHASCRKPHGPGTDALSWLDKEIKENLDKPDKRIQQLFLTGDQIYADDVATCLLPMVYDLGLLLMGSEDDPSSGEEELPIDDDRHARVTLQSAPPMRRNVLVRRHAGFTSVEAQNHLLTFGEYAAMYLAAWSPRVWRRLGDEERCYEHLRGTSPFKVTDLDLLFVPQGVPRPSDADFRELMRTKNRPAFRAERQRVIVFAATVAKVARVLANVSSYMIFDDHDVTDDWNLNATWHKRVFSRPMGRAIMRNALLAYTYFQAWGSDWESFKMPDSPNGKLMAAAEAYLAVTRGRPADKAAALDSLFGFKSGVTERARFHYEARGSLYQIRVLDSRTRRSFQFSTGVASPFLMGHEDRSSLDEQLPKGPRRSGTEFLLVLASTPVLGPELLERLLLPIAMQVYDAYWAIRGVESDLDEQPPAGEHESSLGLFAARSPGAMFFDAETWPSNERGQHELLDRLATYEKVVVLGGDVHYGTNLFVDWYTFDRTVGESSRKKARIVQLTSSAARNAFETRIEAIYRGYHWLNQWMFGSGFEGLAWKEHARIERRAGAEAISLTRFGRMREKPALVPAFGWPAGWEIGPGDGPDAAWRMEMVRDMRPDAERAGPFSDAAEQLKPDIDAAHLLPRGIERSRAAARVHNKARSLEFAPLREVVFTNNVGIVTFELRPDGIVRAVHTLLSTDQNGYPEDKPDDALADARPLGDGAQVASPLPNTVARVDLVPAPAAPTLHGGVR